jgi:hypothetical protein
VKVCAVERGYGKGIRKTKFFRTMRIQGHSGFGEQTKFTVLFSVMVIDKITV